MTVHELIERLSKFDGNLQVNCPVEAGHGSSTVLDVTIHDMPEPRTGKIVGRYVHVTAT